MRTVIVIGAGASGLMAAIAAARQGAQVTILEGMDRPGKKILVSGNGRCNLTNLDPGLSGRYRSSDPKELTHFSESLFSGFSVDNTLDFFHECGLLTTEREGYVYPYTNQASSVLDVLLTQVRKHRIRLKLSEKVRKIEHCVDNWSVFTDTWHYSCDRVILCCGSKAAPATGSDGSGYKLAASLGHTVLPILPALTALRTKEPLAAACEGTRCQAALELYRIDRNTRELLARDRGEIQWTRDAISGIAVFQVSRFAAQALAGEEKIEVVLDLLPCMTAEKLSGMLMRLRETDPGASVQEILSGLLPKKLISGLLSGAGIKPGREAASVSEQSWAALTGTIKELHLSITGTRDFDQSQVCSGGIPLREADPVTMESRLQKGLYFAGEILDADGPCGGYNLQWAWSTGFLAGTHAGSSD